MRAALLAATMLGGLATGAEAAVIASTTILGVFDPYYSQLYQDVPGFNTALGGLNSITVRTQATLSEGVTVQTATGGPAPASGLFNTRFAAFVIGTSQATSTFVAPSQSVQVPLTPVPSLGADIGTGTVTARFENSFTVAAADFRGLGDPALTIRYDIFALAGAGLAFPNDASSFTRVTGNVTVAYDYTPAATAVPEPVSMSLLGVGLMGLAAARRRPAI